MKRTKFKVYTNAPPGIRHGYCIHIFPNQSGAVVAGYSITFVLPVRVKVLTVNANLRLAEGAGRFLGCSEYNDATAQHGRRLERRANGPGPGCPYPKNARAVTI